ncbi:MAG: hypothetical protein J3Q66DRAFT_417331 [Benniella sp.]|nr:MAG: hypothetical protein J3Q66DRAFT_417331 [Benniella sp.]
MKFLSPRLAAYVAVASGFESLNNGGKKHHHHHHHRHHKHKKDHKHHHHHHHPKPIVKRAARAEVDAQTPFEAHNNGGHVIDVYIPMDSPCTGEHPPTCAAALELAASKETLDGENVELWKKKHHDHHKHKHAKQRGHHDHHKHGKPHHHHHDAHHKYEKHNHHNKHDKPDKHDKNHHKKHPWEGLCVAVGDFCGSKLYGCKFDFTTLYRCTAVGEKPVVLTPDAKICGGSNEGGSCNCSEDSQPVCGAKLPAECKADPASIYYCSKSGKGKWEVLKI